MSEEKVEVTMVINQDFFDKLHTVMGWSGNGREKSAFEHFRNALELYATVIEGMSKGQTPVLVNPKGYSGEKVPLPPLLGQLRHEKEIEFDRQVDFKRNLL